MKSFNVSIISIGDEICIGQILNSNSAWIAHKVTELGAKVYLHLTVRDEKKEIIDALDYAKQSSDYIIITGGLGPTHDDITKEVLAEYFDDKLVFNDQAFDDVQRFFTMRNRQLSERNKEQAYLPSKCVILKNLHGTAPGMMFELSDKFIVSLPGVPLEMRELVSEYVLPHINSLIISNSSRVVKYKTINTIGIPESDLADIIGDTSIFLDENSSLAFLPSIKGVRLRIGAESENSDKADAKIAYLETLLIDKIGRFFLSFGDEHITDKVAEIMLKNKFTLSVAESCTAGMLGAELTKISGSSRFFIGGEIVYSNEAKINRLNVGENTILQYGAVSKETAIEMAQNTRNIYNTNFAIAITGIAGPDGGSNDKPVGTVWIAIADETTAMAEKFSLGQDRETVRERSVFSALYMIYRYIHEKY